MSYILYIDVLFFVNFSMDFLLLAVLRFILKYPFRPLRMLLGAGAGALWACVAAVFPVFPRILEMAVTYILVSGLMLWVSFGLTGIRELIKGIIGLYLSAVMLGGMMYALYQTGFFIQYGAEAIPMIILMLLALGSYFGIRFLWGITEETRKRRKHLCQVRLHYQDQEITVTALLDTGNQLREPVSGLPVHIITRELGLKLCRTIPAVVYIPFSTVGNPSGVMPGIRIDAMEVEQDQGTLHLESPMIAFSQNPVSPDHTYEMLLNANLEK